MGKWRPSGEPPRNNPTPKAQTFLGSVGAQLNSYQEHEPDRARQTTAKDWLGVAGFEPLSAHAAISDRA